MTLGFSKSFSSESRKKEPQSGRSSQENKKQSLVFEDNRAETAVQKQFGLLAQSSSSGQSLGSIQPKKKENKTGLPDDLKAGIEHLSGYGLDEVKVHYNSDKPKQLQAHAFAEGNQIHLAPGQEKHLPHEAWHVVQQKQGRVQPTVQLSPTIGINQNPTLELEANSLGTLAQSKGKSLLQQNSSFKTTQLEKAKNPIQKSSNTGNPVFQLVASQILMDTTDGKIGGVAIVGRPESVYSGTMGDHTTAFTVIASGLANKLSGKTISEASTILAGLVGELSKLPGYKYLYEGTLPSSHAQRLNEAMEKVHFYVNDFRKFRKSKRKNETGLFTVHVENEDEYEFSASLVSHLQQWIDAYLEARELIPMSTINTKAISESLAGKGKGESASALVSAENKESISTDQILYSAWGTFDARSAAAVCIEDNSERLTVIAPGVSPIWDYEQKKELLIRQHLQTLKSIYPNTMQRVYDEKRYSDLWSELEKSIDQKAEESLKVRKGEIKPEKSPQKRVIKEGKRYLTTALSVDEVGYIQHVKIGGRGTSPYSDTMGAHSTAWIVLTDSIWSQLNGLSLMDAAEKLAEIADETESDLKEFAKVFRADDKQLYRINHALAELGTILGKLEQIQEMKESEMDEEMPTYEEDPMGESVEESEMMMVDTVFYSPWEQMLILQEVINSVLNLQNLTPGASLYVGNVNGAREGFYRGVLLNLLEEFHNNEVTFDPKSIQQAIMGLLDMKGLQEHLKNMEGNLTDRPRFQYDPIGSTYDFGYESEKFEFSEVYKLLEISEPTADMDKSVLLLIQHHFKMIEKAYPAALDFSGLKKLSNFELFKLSLESSRDGDFIPMEDFEED